MRMDSIYEEAKAKDHLLVRSNSSGGSDPSENNSVLLAAPENLVLIQSKQEVSYCEDEGDED